MTQSDEQQAKALARSFIEVGDRIAFNFRFTAEQGIEYVDIRVHAPTDDNGQEQFKEMQKRLT